MIKKSVCPICFSEIKIFVSRSFDLIEGHLECASFLCKAFLREEGATHLQNEET